MEPVTSGEERRSDLAAVEPAAAELADGPLQGIRVVEFGQLLAGPFVGTLLGDFGAEVIKIEAPPAGDPMREWGRLRHNGRSMWWSILSRNKQSVTLNLRLEQGQRIARMLAQRADVVLENFRPGTMERWGWAPRSLHELNPGLDLRRGSRATARPAATATAPGFASASGGDLRPSLHQRRIPTRHPRATASRSATRSPRSRRSPGSCSRCTPGTRAAASGQVVDASITDAVLRGHRVRGRSNTRRPGVVREPTGTRLPKIAPSNVYRSKDDHWVVIAANHDTLWRRLAALIGKPELADDPRFNSHRTRGENEDLLDELIGEWAAQHTAEELDRIVNDAGVRVLAGLLGRRRLRRPVLQGARPADRVRGRCPRHDHGAGRRAPARPNAGPRALARGLGGRFGHRGRPPRPRARVTTRSTSSAATTFCEQRRPGRRRHGAGSDWQAAGARHRGDGGDQPANGHGRRATDAPRGWQRRRCGAGCGRRPVRVRADGHRSRRRHVRARVRSREHRRDRRRWPVSRQPRRRPGARALRPALV